MKISMLDNAARARRAVHWIRISVILSALVLLVMVIFAVMVEAPFSVFADPSKDVESSLAFLLFVLLEFVLGAVTLLVAFLSWIFRMLWMYRSLTNLRVSGSPSVSPLLAVLCNMIPVLGYVFSFLVFVSMTRRSEKVLVSRSTEFPKVNTRMLVIGLVFSVIAISMNLFDFFIPLANFILLLLLEVAYWICIGMWISAYSVREAHLFDLLRDEELRTRVEQVLRERKASLRGGCDIDSLKKSEP